MDLSRLVEPQALIGLKRPLEVDLFAPREDQLNAVDLLEVSETDVLGLAVLAALPVTARDDASSLAVTGRAAKTARPNTSVSETSRRSTAFS